MRVAVEGCLHGELQQVFAHIDNLQHKLAEQLDLLIICGDFQAIRHQLDLDDMHCPEKYKQMGSFRQYFEGKKRAPVLTVLIGGNHEAVNSFRESHFGGWLAPKIYFLGQAGCIVVRKGAKRLRIAGGSGIYNHSDFKYNTRLERFPLRGKDRITAYHSKQLDAFRLELLARISKMKKEEPETYGMGDHTFDIVLSHDWPKNIALFGNTQNLFKIKPYFQKEIQAGTLGSPPMLRLLQVAQPSYWFSAHMHVKYGAIYPHPDNRFTHFLSLDKCLGQRSCLQLLYFDLPNSEQEQPAGPLSIEVDSTWISVLLLTRQMMKGCENLYYFDKQELKLVDNSRMNQLIKKYPLMRKTLEDIGSYCFDQELSQSEQTSNFLKRIGLKAIELEGVCFESGTKSQQHQDQIQLDL